MAAATALSSGERDVALAAARSGTYWTLAASSLLVRDKSLVVESLFIQLTLLRVHSKH
jgi:hypothetical protein